MHRLPSVGRRTTSSEVEVPAPMSAPVPVPAGASSEGSEDHAFETSFPPVPENTQSFAGGHLCHNVDHDLSSAPHAHKLWLRLQVTD